VSDGRKYAGRDGEDAVPVDARFEVEQRLDVATVVRRVVLHTTNDQGPSVRKKKNNHFSFVNT